MVSSSAVVLEVKINDSVGDSVLFEAALQHGVLVNGYDLEGVSPTV